MGKNGKLQVERLYRADRVLANRSGKSRSECFALLQEKRIWQAAATAAAAANTAETSTHISKSLIKGPAVKISMHTPLWIDKTESIPLPAPLLQVYHKPCWVLSVRSDPVGRPCLQGILPDMHPVGRLDYDTSGLLLFSSSGPLTQTLLHPKHNVSKEYVAVVTGRVDEEVLRAQFTAGVTTGEGVHTAELLQVEHWNSNNNDNDDNDDNNDTDDTAARNPNPSVTKFLQTVRKNMPAEYNQTDLKVRGYLDVFDATELTTVTLTVAEGKHRMVRRMLANCGHAVVALKRERLGAMELGDLAVGETRRLTPAELEWVEDQMPQKKSSKPYRKKKELSDADLDSDSDGELE
jgi:23S rRNA pseudouridine2605 synthase